MKNILAVAILLATTALTHGDQVIENVQQTLKDQGFYYGEINGQKDADTTAAIRRYQIRNGLQVTGELNDETLRSLRSNPTTPSPAPVMSPSQSASPNSSDLRNDPNDDSVTTHPAPPQSSSIVPPQDRQFYPNTPDADTAVPGGLFAGTPFENSSPDVQRNLIASAQDELTQRGLFREPVDGLFGPKLEFSLRAYQSRVGLPVTGRLDLDTLAALELLPGAHTPVYTPRRPLRTRPDSEAPVRGEWVRP